eukprot:3690294-Pyramimonas_sp.AAC.1
MHDYYPYFGYSHYGYSRSTPYVRSPNIRTCELPGTICMIFPEPRLFLFPRVSGAEPLLAPGRLEN